MENNLRLLGIRFSKRCIEIHLKSKMYAIIFTTKKVRLENKGIERVVIIKYSQNEYQHAMDNNLIEINGFFGLIFCNK